MAASRVEPRESQAGCFRPAPGDVQRLKCVAGGALDQVVYGAHDHYPARVGVDGPADVAPVAAGKDPWIGHAVHSSLTDHQPDERLILPGCPESRGDVAFRD